jgi:aminopeptidase N
MKKLFIFFLFTSQICFSQQDVDIESIAKMEMLSHQQRGGAVFGRETSLASNNYDVKYYKCEWAVDPAIRFINGKVTVYFKTTETSSSITLDLHNALMVDSVKKNSTTYTFTQSNNTLVVNFPTQINANIIDSVSIWYKGIPASTGFGSFIQDTHAGTPVMWSLSEPYGAQDWWPCKNSVADKADSIDIFITHPTIYKAASNGMLQSEVAVAGAKTKTHWKHRYPISTYLICIAVTNYTVFNNSVQLGAINLPMVTYCYPESLAAFQTNTPLVLEAMQLFHNNFGPYPFINEKYGHVQFGWGGGMEHQTSTFIINAGENLMAHELGHQWFGDKITCASWDDIWLNEGFATYLAAYNAEVKYPASIIANRNAVIANVTSLPDGSVKVMDTSNLNQVFNSRLSYRKGSCLLFMLRFILGDDVFLRAIRRYQQDPAVAYGNAKTADLKRNLEAESGKNLTYFFDQWYTGQGYPSYKVKWNVLDSTKVFIKLSQTTSHTSVPFFKLPVQLTFKNATQSKAIIVDNNTNGETFINNIGFSADTVLIDPNAWLVTKNNSTEKTAATTTPIPTNSGEGIVDIYPNPVVNPMSILLHDFKDETASISIFNKLGQKMHSENVLLTYGTAQVTIATNKWAKGMYIIKVIAGGKTVVKQIIF